MHINKLLIIPAIAVLVACIYMSSAAQGKPTGGWTAMTLPVPVKDDSPRIKSFSIDKGGVPWAIIYDALYYWNGKHYVKPANNGPKFNLNSDGLFGGGDRDLYAVQSSDLKNGSLWKLGDGSATRITDCFLDSAHSTAPVYVSNAGKLYNWGVKFLAVYSSGSWKRIETTLSISNTLIFEVDNTVYFYYNGTLCSADAADNLISRDVTIPFKEIKAYDYMKGAKWGKECIILSSPSENGIAILNLRTGELVPQPDNVIKLLADLKISGLVSQPDGSVIISGRVTHNNQQYMYVVDPNSKIDTIELGNYITGINNALSNPRFSFPSIDDSLWIGLYSGGIIQIKNGAVILHDWRNGAPFGTIRAIRKGKGNFIYAATENNIYAYNSNTKYQTTGDWTEFVSNNSNLIRDAKGRMWMFLADQPGKISCWINGNWKHYSFPEDPGSIFCSFSDDRGHILFECSQGSYDISSDGINKFKTLEDALVAAVADGARSFSSPNEQYGCIVTDKGQIILRRSILSTSLYDGKQWNLLPTSPEDSAIFKSAKHGFVFRHSFDELSFRRYDTGQLVPYWYTDNPKQFLLGRSGLQPYDEDLLNQQPNSYFTSIRNDIDSITLRAKPGDDGKIISNYSFIFSVQGSGYNGGLWLNTSYMGKRFFYLGGKVIDCNFTNTPLDISPSIRIDMYDDCEGNLWANVGSYFGKHHIYMRKAPKARLKIANPPAASGHSVKLKLNADSRILKSSQLFWTVDDGEWRPYEKDKTSIVFPSNGKHQVRLIAVDNTGCAIAASSPVTIKVQGEYPKTELTSTGPFTVKEIKWKLPVKGSSSTPKVKIGLTYRIDNKEWRIATKSGEAMLTGISDGYHKIEVAALENGVFRDPNPVSFDFTFSPNWKEAASKILTMLDDPDAKINSQGLVLLKELAPGVIPELRTQLYIIRDTLKNPGNIDNALYKLGY